MVHPWNWKSFEEIKGMVVFFPHWENKWNIKINEKEYKWAVRNSENTCQITDINWED